MPATNRQILLAARPVGAIKPSDFRFQEEPAPEPEPEQLLLRNLYLSLDPAMRGWMSGNRDSYMPPVEVNEVMRGGTISEVLRSSHPDIQPGDKVVALGGWQDYCLAHPQHVMKLPAELPLPLTNFLSILGITGLTAYFGLLDIGKPKSGDTVLVSAAAGAVGSAVGQIARIKGCRVVGLAGTAEKCRWLTEELGFDAAINYRTEPVRKAIREHCPDRIDIYFDNVGGDVLNEALGFLNVGARVVICGAISIYNATEPQPGPSNYINLLLKRARMEGFIVRDYAARYNEGIMQLGQWVAAGQIKHREDIVDGLENAPSAIQKLFDGENMGKLMIRIAEPGS